MLLQDLYTITSLQKEDNAVTALLTLDATHPVFKGHFPGRPVLPGACQLQMVKEIMQTVLNADLQLVKANQVKFLSLIVPEDSGVLQMDIKHDTTEELGLIVTASIISSDKTCFKFTGTFRVVLRDAW